MKFYDNIKNPRYEASPFAIDVDDTHLFYTSTDATPFILYQSGIVFGVPGGEHDDIECRNKGKRPLIRGRWWVKANALVLWECTCSYEVKCSFLKKFVGTVKKFGIDGLNIRFFEDFGRFREEDGNRRMQIVIMETTVREYLSLNIQEKEENWFWRTFDSQGKEKSLGGNITKNGMGSRDIWRHYEITELKTNKNMNNNVIINKNMKKNVVKINENTLRQIVAESVRKVLKEGDSFNYYKDKEDKSGELTKKILFLRSNAVQLYEFIEKGDGIWGYRVGDSEEMQQERLELANDVVRAINRLYKSVNEADFNDAERWNKFGV